MSTKKFENLVSVSVNHFNNGEPDKNGKDPVILNVLAGKAPNRTVLSGTVAENAGFKVGNSYLAQCRETEMDEQYGRQFIWNSIKELSVMDILESKKNLGAATIFDAAEAPAEVQQAVPANEEVA